MNLFIRRQRAPRPFFAALLFTSLPVTLAILAMLPLLPTPAAGALHTPAPATRNAAASALLMAKIAAQLGHARGVRAQFVQTQTSAALKQPLVSTGTLAFFREQGAIWQTETPWRATDVMTDAGVAAFDMHGQRMVPGHGNASANGNARGIAQVSQMMRAMLGGDLSALYTQFSVRAQGTPAHWRVTLVPSQPQLAQVMRTMQMSGGDYLATLHITFAHGDALQINFMHSRPATAPTDAERALLAWPHTQ
jgi:outer membrane lipoprotein-sorting protein